MNNKDKEEIKFIVREELRKILKEEILNILRELELENNYQEIKQHKIVN